MDRRNARSESVATLSFFTLTVLLVLGAAYLCVNDSLFKVMIALAQQSELLSSRYFGEVAPDKVFADAWRGMQSAIPFRVELSDGGADRPTMTPRARNWGLTLRPQDSAVVVADIAESSPFSGFLLPQDKITGVDTLRNQVVIDFIDYLNSRSEGATQIFFEREGRDDSVTAQIAAIESADGARVAFEDSICFIVLRLPAALDIEQEIKTLNTNSALGFIVDLRDSGGDDHKMAQRISKLIEDSVKGKPLAILIDRTTKGAAEEIARNLATIDEATTIGASTAGSLAEVDEILLRSGQRLYVSLDERIDHGFSEVVDTLLDSTKTSEPSTAVIPSIECRKPRMSSLLFELIHGGYLLDFVTANKFPDFPRSEDEDSLLAQFENYLRDRRFRYDPLGRALSDISLNDMNKEMDPIYRHMRETHRDIGDVSLDEYKVEIVRTLLKTIHRVKIGGEPSLEISARTDDPCLAEALAIVKKAAQ